MEEKIDLRKKPLISVIVAATALRDEGLIESMQPGERPMLNSDNRAYYERRARQERQRAGSIFDGGPAALAHLRMAEEYERRLANADGGSGAIFAHR